MGKEQKTWVVQSGAITIHYRFDGDALHWTQTESEVVGDQLVNQITGRGTIRVSYIEYLQQVALERGNIAAVMHTGEAMSVVNDIIQSDDGSPNG